MNDREGLVERIHAEIDGFNDEEQSARLRDRLARDVDARELYADLVRLRSMLEGLDDVEVPTEVTERVKQAVATERASRTPRFRFTLGHAAALAAGLTIGVVGAQWSDDLDTNGLSGTFVAAESVGEPELTLSVDGLVGSVGRRLDEQSVVVPVEWRAERGPVEIVVRYEPSLLAFAGIAQRIETLDALSIADGELRVTAGTAASFTLQFNRRRDGATTLEMRVAQPGRPAAAGRLAIPGTDR